MGYNLEKTLGGDVLLRLIIVVVIVVVASRWTLVGVWQRRWICVLSRIRVGSVVHEGS